MSDFQTLFQEVVAQLVIDRFLNTTDTNSTTNSTDSTNSTNVTNATNVTNTTNTNSSESQGSIILKNNITNVAVTGVHIANFKAFFKISAFFIAYVIFYAITVPLIMRYINNSWKVVGGLVKKLMSKQWSIKVVNFVTLIWILYVLVIPFVLIIVWGLTLCFDPNFSNQFGVGITLIGLFLLFVFLGFCDWVGHDWHLTKFTITMFISATVSSFLYCFVVIFLPDYFTYNGTTAIFLALNFIFSSALIYLKTDSSSSFVELFSKDAMNQSIIKSKERFIKLDLLVEAVVSNASFQSSDPQQKEKLNQVLSDADQMNKKYFIATRIFCLLAYLGTLIAYFIVIIALNPKPQKLVGLVHTILILTSDQMIYRLDNERQYFVIKDWFKCLYQFIARFLCCFLLDYWLCMQSLAFFITIAIVSINLTEKLIIRTPKNAANVFHKMCYENPLFQAFVEAQVKEVTCPVGPPQGQKAAQERTVSQKISYFMGEIWFFIHLCAYLAIAAGAAKAKNSIMTVPLVFQNIFHQWVIALFSLMFGLLLGLIYAWFRYFQKMKYATDWKLFISFLIIEGVSIAMGFVFYGLLDVKVHLIWTSFALLPAIVASFLLFVGHWISNDYFFYSQQQQSAPSQQPPNNQQVIDIEKTQINPESGPVAQNQNRDRLFQIDKEAFCSDLKQLIICGYLPRNKGGKDKLTFMSVMLNIGLLLIYTILTASIFKPWWVGFTVGIWWAIIQLTLIIFIKYYQTYYQMNFMIQFSILLSFCLFIGWTVIMGIYIIAFYRHQTVALVAFCLGSFGYVFLGMLALGCMKLLTITDKLAPLPLGLRILFSLAFSVIGGVGILILIVSTHQQVWGQVMVGIAVYLIFLLNLQAYRLKVSIAFAVVLLAYAIFAIVFYHSYPNVVLQALSVILIVILLFFGLNFARKFLENRNKREKQIFIYSRTLFPTLKYLYSEQKMISSNGELIYFCLTALTFFVWSFLAGILLKLQDRYIGISFMAITISIVYLYVSDRLKKAVFLESDKFKIANLRFYMSSIAHALEVKQSWRMSQMNQKSLKPAAGSGTQGALPTQIVVEQELSYQAQWLELYKVQSAELEDKLAKTMYFSFRGKQRDLAFNFSDPRATEQDTLFKNGDTQEKKIETLLNTKDIMQKECLFDVQFYAFLNAYMNLKMKNLEEDIKNAIERWNSGDHGLAPSPSGQVTPSTIAVDMVETEAQRQIREGIEQRRKEEASKLIIQQSIASLEEDMRRKKEQFMIDQQRAMEVEQQKAAQQHEKDVIAKRMEEQRLQFEQEQEAQRLEHERQVREEQERKTRAEMEAWRLKQESEKERQKIEMEAQIRRMQEQEEEQRRRKAEDTKRQEEEHRRRQQAFMEAEANRKREEEQRNQNNAVIADNTGGIQTKEKSSDELYLQQEGDRMLSLHAKAQVYQDAQFSKAVALGPNKDGLGWTRIKDIVHDDGKSVVTTKVFDDGVSACDIKQGSLGDCYLLSAMSVMAHARPELVQKIFYSKSRDYQDNGLYTMMFFRNRKPVIITVDDSFPADQRKRHAYVKIGANAVGTKEVWPMLIEKAYAKMYGSYPNIEGGLVDEALADLTNGAPYRFDLTDEDVKKMYNSGEFWDKLVFWSSRNYLMGAGSPSGSDADVSPLGIVQGHAYSVLDVCEIEGTKLIQLRNPWGDETEWKGPWGDNSKEWTERRRRIVYDRMKQKNFQVSEIGKSDGIFWMSLADFFKNFEQLFLCRFFNEEYTEISYASEWSKAKGTAGGCCNFDTVGKNPQLKLTVTGPGPVEIFCFLQVEQPFGGQSADVGIGFQIYDMKGKPITNRRIPDAVVENHRGYMVSKSVSLDTKIKPLAANAYTLLLTTFDKDQDAKFNFTLWYNKSQGTVTMTEF